MKAPGSLCTEARSQSGLCKAKYYQSLIKKTNQNTVNKKPPQQEGNGKDKDNSGLLYTDICINRVSWQHTQTSLGFSDIQNRNKPSAEQNKGHDLPKRAL